MKNVEKQQNPMSKFIVKQRFVLPLLVSFPFVFLMTNAYIYKLLQLKKIALIIGIAPICIIIIISIFDQTLLIIRYFISKKLEQKIFEIILLTLIEFGITENDFNKIYYDFDYTLLFIGETKGITLEIVKISKEFSERKENIIDALKINILKLYPQSKITIYTEKCMVYR